jgi:hypothetical protein
MQEVQIGGWSRQRGHKLQEPISKIIKAKMTGGMAQMVELLPTKHARPKIKKKRRKNAGGPGARTRDSCLLARAPPLGLCCAPALLFVYCF